MSKPKTLLARRLRRRQTIHETKLWALLRDRRLCGYKFYRQYVIKGFIVDFCCWRYRLVIELDGGGHMTLRQRAYDRERDAVIRQAGYRVVRVWNRKLETNPDGVIERIVREMMSRAPRH